MTPATRRAIEVGVRLVAVAAIASSVHVLLVAIGVGIGLLAGHVLWSVAITEAVVLVVTASAAAVTFKRAYGAAGLGIALGWLAGAAGMATAAAVFIIMCVVAAVAVLGLMLVSFALA
jgi:hypothetical protein